MALTKEALAQLISLQERDSSLDKLRDAIEEMPRQVAALRSQLEGKKAQISEIKSRIIGLEKKKKEQELDLAAKEESIKKHSSELNQVKTNDAFKALQHEIDSAKSKIGENETVILEIMDETDRLRREEKPMIAEMGAEEKKINDQVAVLEGQLKDLKEKFDREKAQRDQDGAPLAGEMMRVYDHARSRGKRDAIVPIDNSNCSACRVVLPQQVIIEATKAKQLIICENCQRILYLKDVVFAKAA
jgi:predicted  nucleic acid-binding Zn-ribbon protein